MIVGFNHNIMYKGEIFHIQTEDSGIANPHIITLIYRGGTILSSKKTSYADIIKVDSLEQVVESIMKEQHKEMLRRLKSGEFDERAFGSAAKEEVAATAKVAEPAPDRPAQEPVVQKSEEPGPEEILDPTPAEEPVPLEESTLHLSAKAVAEPPKKSQSLDEIILNYLITGDDK